MTDQPTRPNRLQRSSELLWGTGERSNRGPKPSLSLDRIVTAAVSIADRAGVDALSMRCVARELGVGTMSLYRYVPGKDELLDLMLDRVSELGDDAEQLAGKDWRTVLEHAARGSYQLYLEHRWLLQVNWARPVFGPNTLAGVELITAGLADTPLTDRERVMVMSIVDGYAVGMARGYVQYTQAAAETGISDEEFWAAQHPVLEHAMTTGNYPTLAGMAEDAFDAGWEETFEFGLARLLDGLEHMFAARTRPDAGN